MEKGKELYSGKAKSVFETTDPTQLVMVFRDDTSAFDGIKVEKLNRKGMVNNRFSAFIMDQKGAGSHEPPETETACRQTGDQSGAGSHELPVGRHRVLREVPQRLDAKPRVAPLPQYAPTIT